MSSDNIVITNKSGYTCAIIVIKPDCPYYHKEDIVDIAKQMLRPMSKYRYEGAIVLALQNEKDVSLSNEILQYKLIVTFPSNKDRGYLIDNYHDGQHIIN